MFQWLRKKTIKNCRYSRFSVGYLLCFLTSQKNQGFTSSECLLFIFFLVGLVGILSSLTCQRVKGVLHREQRQVGYMNRAQQAYFLEHSAFTDNIEKLERLSRSKENYTYSIRATDKAVFHYGIARPNIYQYRCKCFVFFCGAVHELIRSYVGGVFVVPATEVDRNAAAQPMTTVAIVCEADSPSPSKPAEPTYQNGKVTCGKGTTKVK